MENDQKKYRNPWAWVPTLYFAQGIPYVVVMTVSVIMYKRLGISKARHDLRSRRATGGAAT